MKPTTLFPFFTLAIASSPVFAQQHRKVPLKSITSLTFTANRYTTGRRNSPVPQLNCITQDTCRLFRPSNVLCHNAGWDGVDVSWRCEADLPDNMKFSSVEVLCEGWGSENDENILAGSCGLEYGLTFIDGGHGGYHERHGSSHESYHGSYQHHQGRKTSLLSSFIPSFISKPYSFISSLLSSAAHTLITIFWIVMALFVVYSFIQSCMRGPRSQTSSSRDSRGWWPGGGGGWGGGGWGGGGWGGGSGFGGSYGGYGSDSYYKSRPSRNDGPGFWSGLGLGTAAGYAAGRRSASSSSSTTPPTASFSSARYSSPGSNSSGGGSSSRVPSSTMRTASGFGGTRRR